jgi:hypothetical protein
MLRSAEDLHKCSVDATDGAMGHVTDLYFDDAAWVIRYLVVETGSWLASRKVLIAPDAIDQLDGMTKTLQVQLTREQVRGSPHIDTDKPVSRQHERDFRRYYGYPLYWDGGGLLGACVNPVMPVNDFPDSGAGSSEGFGDAVRSVGADPFLRSYQTVKGYAVEARDGEIGHAEGLLIELGSWAVRYLIVNTSNWWMGHAVLVAPAWIDCIHWESECIDVDLTRDAIRHSPAFEADALPDRQREIDIHLHHGRRGYWSDDDGHRSALRRP